MKIGNGGIILKILKKGPNEKRFAEGPDLGMSRSGGKKPKQKKKSFAGT
jgi:hypothetical protein